MWLSLILFFLPSWFCQEVPCERKKCGWCLFLNILLVLEGQVHPQCTATHTTGSDFWWWRWLMVGDYIFLLTKGSTFLCKHVKRNAAVCKGLGKVERMTNHDRSTWWSSACRITDNRSFVSHWVGLALDCYYRKSAGLSTKSEILMQLWWTCVNYRCN